MSIVRKNTRYILTNRRAIIESGAFRQTTQSVTLTATSEIVFREGRNGRGSLEFGSGMGGPFGMLPRNWPGAGRYMPPAFDGIEDARRVYTLALEGQRSGTG